MNTIRTGNFRFLTAMVCALFIGGCTTLQPVNVAQERATIKKGDTVVVTTETGQVHTFRIVDITTGGIHGRELSIPFSDIRLLQIRRVDTRKTALLTLGVIGLGAIAADDDDDGGGGY